MPGRHQAGPRRRPRLRWLVGVAGGAALAATLVVLTSGTAGASVDPVKATFGVTGVSTSNCPISTGGTDVYVLPGQELDVKSSIVGLTLLGVPLDLSKLASLDGALIINPKSANPIKLDITNTIQKVTGLTTGNHAWKWTVRTVKVGTLAVPLGLSSDALKAGAKLTWTGTIHVTSAAANCGIAVQLPSVSASVSVTGLPPIGVGIPGVKVSVPVNVPTSVPTGNLPGTGGSKTGSNDGGHPHSSKPANNPIPVPARVVPGADGSGLLGSGIDFGGVLPGANSIDSGQVPDVPAEPRSGSGANTAAGLPDQTSAGKNKTIDLAASEPASTGEVWVVLAIVAVIALAFVAATYARLYLMKRGS
jgi:hypothetical protein